MLNKLRKWLRDPEQDKQISYLYQTVLGLARALNADPKLVGEASTEIAENTQYLLQMFEQKKK